MFKAYWGRDEDISQGAVLADICRRCGIDAAAFQAGIAEPAVKDRLKANTDELIRRGGFGSPTIFVNGDEMYFGNDRLPLVRQALGATAAAHLRAAAPDAGAARPAIRQAPCAPAPGAPTGTVIDPRYHSRRVLFGIGRTA